MRLSSRIGRRLAVLCCIIVLSSLKGAMSNSCTDGLKISLWRKCTTLLLSPLFVSHLMYIYPASALESKSARYAPELIQALKKGQQLESSGNLLAAQQIYEEIVQAEPSVPSGWGSLGNVLTAEGNLPQALLCYKKAVRLNPPRDELSILLVNEGVVEMNLGDNNQALENLQLAIKVGGESRNARVNEAVALSRLHRFREATAIFDKLMDTADRYALPWWLRYSMALAETSRSAESIAILQRVLNRYPNEDEVNAFAAAVYSSTGARQEAKRYWEKLSSTAQQQYSQASFLTDSLYWGPTSIQGLQSFLLNRQ